MNGRLLAILLISVPWGCAVLSTDMRDEVHIPQVSEVLKQGDVLEVSSQTILSPDQLLEILSVVPIVFVGEIHDRRGDHALQLQIIRGLHATGDTLWIGMEMFQRRHQEALNRFLLGELDEEGLQEAVDWSTNWGHDFRLYAPILRFARENHITILALNASRKLVKKVAREGISGLSPEEREKLPKPWPSLSEEYGAYLQARFEEHGHGNLPSFEYFTQAQLLWDATMAETLADHIETWLDPNVLHVVVLAGKGHVMKGMGIPEALRARISLPYSIVVPIHPGEGSEIDPSTADYLVAVTDGGGTY